MMENKALINDQLDNVEKDAIGEIMNISMGAAATAISTLLDRQVSITTPKVSVIKIEDFEYSSLEPAIGIEIEYIEGLKGSNFMIMKRRDIRKIVDLLLSGSGDAESDEELDEMHISAVGEIMNQMMGSSSTALARFFGKSINISPPHKFDLVEINEKLSQSILHDQVVTVYFNLKIEGLIDSQFVTILTIEFTKELVKNALNMEEDSAHPSLSQSDKEAPSEPNPPAKAPVAGTKEEKKQPAAVDNSSTQKEEQPSNQNKVSVQPLRFENFDAETPKPAEDENGNLSMIMSVPLDITVEIGRARKMVHEILEIRSGSVVELDKQAGDPVDVIVNGQLMARGDVVVIDDNFGVRITEIISNKEIAHKFK